VYYTVCMHSRLSLTLCGPLAWYLEEVSFVICQRIRKPCTMDVCVACVCVCMRLGWHCCCPHTALCPALQ
jgi:hypothetical protein